MKELVILNGLASSDEVILNDLPHKSEPAIQNLFAAQTVCNQMWFWYVAALLNLVLDPRSADGKIEAAYINLLRKPRSFLYLSRRSKKSALPRCLCTDLSKAI